MSKAQRGWPMSKPFYDFVKITGAVPALLWYRPRVIHCGEYNLKSLKGVMVCSNHIGMTDPILVQAAFWYRRMRFMATKELYSSKLKRFFFNNVDCILVDRDNFSMDSFHTVCDALKNGQLVAIFPEGAIKGGDGAPISKLKSGAALMAHMGNAPIVPVYLVPKKHWYSRATVLVGDPIFIKDIYGSRPSMAEINSASELIRTHELELIKYYKGLVNKRHGE